MFYWVGNKIKYIDIIKKYCDKFNTVVDPMMGSGNHLIKLAEDKDIVGSDIIKLMPYIYSDFNKFNISIDSFIQVNNKWNKFTQNSDYYSFREYWNRKYIKDYYDELFLVETFLLLRMCSNSMVRFNSRGLFNQGFRGINVIDGNIFPFFKDVQFQEYASQLNYIKKMLSNGNYNKFYNMDIMVFLYSNKNLFDYNNTIFIFDPPYILDDTHRYSGSKYTAEYDNSLYKFITENKLNFIYFNFINRNGNSYKLLEDFIKDNKLNVINLNEKSHSGQGRVKTMEVSEVLITNINIESKIDKFFEIN